MKIKNKITKRISILSSLTLLSSYIMPFIPYIDIEKDIYAESKTKDSIGSVNMEDDGINIGVDKTQIRDTQYSDEIKEESLQNAEVYVSQASSFGVFIPKTIILDGKKNDENINKANYVVSLSAGTNFAGNELVKVIPDSEFTLSQLGKNDIQATVTQDKKEWLHNEIDTKGNGEVSAIGMSAGAWKGSFNFNVELESNYFYVLAIDENGKNLNAKGNYILGEDKETLLTSLVENNYVSNKEEVDLLINVEADSFIGTAFTTFDVSEIANEGDVITIYHYNETTNEWEYIGTSTVKANGTITGNFNSFSPVAFTVELKENHICDYKLKEILEEPTCTLEGLAKYECKCGDSYEQVVDALGHTEVNGSTEESHIICDVCKVILSTEHNITSEITKEATCTINGIKTYTCECGYSYTEDIIAQHYYENNICTVCGNEEPGLYDTNGIMLCSWKDSEINVEQDYVSTEGDEFNCKTNVNSPYYVLNNNYPETTKVVFPDNIETIGALTFYQCSMVKEFIVPEGVKNLKAYAFQSCPNLKNVQLPESLTNIEKYALSKTPKLTNIELPSSIETIPAGLLWQSGLTKVVIPKNVKTIDFAAFRDCINLEKVTFEDGSQLETLGNFADIDATSFTAGPFFSCTNLKTINLPVSVKYIGDSTFRNCSNLNIQFDLSNIEKIGHYAFGSCNNLESNVNLQNVNYLGQGAFYDCQKITNLNLSEDITIIKNYSFYNCMNLQDALNFPDNIEEMEYSAFRNCTSIKNINFGENSKLKTLGIYSDINENTFKYGVFQGCSGLTNVNLPTSLVNIGDGTFYQCSSFNLICDTKNLEQIGKYAFYNILQTEQELNLNLEKVNYIGSCAFYNCSSIETISNLKNLTNIESYAFYNCSSLTTITGLENVKTIGESSFDNCSSLSGISIKNVETIGFAAFSGCSNLTTITGLENVKTIGNIAFLDCSSLSIDLNLKNVTHIGKMAFCRSNIKSISNLTNVETIGDAAFSSCTNLTKVLDLEKIENIGTSTFSGCTNLTKVTLGENVKSIKAYAFFDCPILKSIVFENPNGWYVSTTEGQKTTLVPASDLSNPTTAATRLTSTYYNYYWTK